MIDRGCCGGGWYGDVGSSVCSSVSSSTGDGGGICCGACSSSSGDGDGDTDDGGDAYMGLYHRSMCIHGGLTS